MKRDHLEAIPAREPCEPRIALTGDEPRPSRKKTGREVPWHVFSVGEACPVKAFVEFVSEPIELRASAFAGVFLCVEQPHP